MAAPTNATRWMLETRKALLKATISDPKSEAWTSFLQVLVAFREALACTVCKGIVVDGWMPRPDEDCARMGGCQHHVCAGCVGKKKCLKPSCSLCNRYDSYDRCSALDIHVRIYWGICTFCRTLNQFPTVKSLKFKDPRTWKTLPEGLSTLTLDIVTLEPKPIFELLYPSPPEKAPKRRCEPVVDGAAFRQHALNEFREQSRGQAHGRLEEPEIQQLTPRGRPQLQPGRRPRRPRTWHLPPTWPQRLEQLRSQLKLQQQALEKSLLKPRSRFQPRVICQRLPAEPRREGQLRVRLNPAFQPWLRRFRAQLQPQHRSYSQVRLQPPGSRAFSRSASVSPVRAHTHTLTVRRSLPNVRKGSKTARRKQGGALVEKRTEVKELAGKMANTGVVHPAAAATNSVKGFEMKGGKSRRKRTAAGKTVEWRAEGGGECETVEEDHEGSVNALEEKSVGNRGNSEIENGEREEEELPEKRAGRNVEQWGEERETGESRTIIPKRRLPTRRSIEEQRSGRERGSVGRERDFAESPAKSRFPRGEKNKLASAPGEGKKAQAASDEKKQADTTSEGKHSKEQESREVRPETRKRRLTRMAVEEGRLLEVQRARVEGKATGLRFEVISILKGPKKLAGKKKRLARRSVGRVKAGDVVGEKEVGISAEPASAKSRTEEEAVVEGAVPRKLPRERKAEVVENVPGGASCDEDLSQNLEGVCVADELAENNDGQEKFGSVPDVASGVEEVPGGVSHDRVMKGIENAPLRRKSRSSSVSGPAGKVRRKSGAVAPTPLLRNCVGK